MIIENDKVFAKSCKNGTETPVWSYKGHAFKKQEERVHWVSMGHEIQFNNKFGVKLNLIVLSFFECFQLITIVVMCNITKNVLDPSAFNLEFQYLVEVGLRVQNII